MEQGISSTRPPAAPLARAAAWLRGRLRAVIFETHFALPLFALLPLVAIWLATTHFIDVERRAAIRAARDTVREQVDIYEAQVARNLNAIDQTLKVVKYAVQMNGAQGALPALRRQGLLPPGLVFVVSVADRDGRIVASNPEMAPQDVSQLPSFTVHRNGNNGQPFVSYTLSEADGQEPHLRFTRRIDDGAGGFAGVVVVDVDPAYFTSSYERSRQGEHGLLGLVGNDGVARALRIGDKLSWNQRIDLAKLDADAMHPGVTLPDGVARYVSMRRLHGFPLSAIVGLADSEQMATFEQHRANYRAAALGGSLLLVAVVALISAWSWQLSKARRRERRAQETYAAASEASLDAIFVLRCVYDKCGGADGAVVDFTVEETNRPGELLTGHTKDSMRGHGLSKLMPSYMENGIFEELAHVALHGGVAEGEWQAVTPPATGRWLQRQVVQVENGVVATVRDITERKRTEDRIRHMAHHDELTGLPNRTLIRDRLEQAVRNAQRSGGCLALAFVDLDGFKLVNDGLGHNAGDELLKVVATRMQGCLRRSDTLGRLGGDEFVILLPDVADSALVLNPLLEKIRDAVGEPVLVDGQAVQVGCSMGVVMYPRDGDDPKTLMMNADAAMYRAKELGKHNFQFYTREMNASLEEKLILLEGMRKALDTTLAFEAGGIEPGPDANCFHLLYQPKIDLRSGHLFGAEALIRWHHPEHGVVPPDRFIGLAEESGLIVALGEWVVRRACRQAQAWRAAGLDGLTVSVNVSARQFEERRLVERVAAALAESGLPPEALELEVTESLLMRDLHQALERMGELKAMGVSLSIDDFGTGYSSLSALKSFPISTLKIDKSFVRDLAHSPDDQAIALAVISLAHRLHLRVIAEGVETEEQREFLRAHECDEMQGYLFSPPVAAGRIAAMLETQARRTRPRPKLVG